MALRFWWRTSLTRCGIQSRNLSGLLKCLDWKEQCSAASYAACCMKLPMVEVFLCSDENYATSTLSELVLVVQRNLYEIVRQHFRDS